MREAWLKASVQQYRNLVGNSIDGIVLADEDGTIVLPHLLGRYYRAQAGRERGGLGLGLYISKCLVEAHGEHIWAESEPGLPPRAPLFDRNR